MYVLTYIILIKVNPTLGLHERHMGGLILLKIRRQKRKKIVVINGFFPILHVHNSIVYKKKLRSSNLAKPIKYILPI